MTQSPAERRFSKLAAAINQKWHEVGTPGVKITAYDLAGLYSDNDGCCSYCGIEVGWDHVSFDHVVPFHRGGHNVIANLTPCCITCQHEKYTKSVEELDAWRALQVVCPVDGTVFRPRWADWKRGLGRYCSRRCSGAIGGAA